MINNILMIIEFYNKKIKKNYISKKNITYKKTC